MAALRLRCKWEIFRKKARFIIPGLRNIAREITTFFYPETKPAFFSAYQLKRLKLGYGLYPNAVLRKTNL